MTKQIAYVMQMRSDLVGEGDRITIGVTRSTDGQAATTEVTEDTLLAPGDTITITLEVPPGAVAN
ncbi:MAG: hypothetical protein E5V19_01715 [Mesorhizobium sp.]|nr:MAG: hypothetical protein E5V19_01715 [Mesorhizobium sp.]